MRQKRRDGSICAASGGQERLLRLLYQTAPGRMLLKPLTAPFISKAAGRLLSTRASCVLIKPFIRRNRIDMSLFEDIPYRSYNEFFSRKIRPGKRPLSPDPLHLISPCDSKLTVLPITPDAHFTLKHTPYTVASLLRDEKAASAYVGGYALIFRLTVDDYHRYCYPADAQREEDIRIAGVLHTVNPIANDHFPIYKENTREYCVLHTEAFGDLIMMEVGALLVGRIVNLPSGSSVCRGEEKGYFQFGGSTIVLLAQAGKVQIDPDLLENTQNGFETVVRYGERIGVAVSESIS